MGRLARTALCLALTALCLGAGGALRARAQQSAPEEKLLLNFRDAPAATIIETIARATGMQIIMDSAVRAQLTIALEDKVTPAEAFEILNAALLTIGQAMVPSPSGGYVVLPIEAAKSAAPWLHRSASEDSERMVTTLVRLTSANAADLGKLLAPSDRSSLVIPYEPTNSLIIAAAEDRVAYLIGLLRALDQAAASQLVVLPLRWADANAVGTQLQTVLNPENDSRPELPVKVTVDARTNSLIVSGAPKRVAEVKRYIALVDIPARSKSKVHVVRVMNIEATDLAEKLSSLSFDEPTPGTGSLGAPAPGRISQPLPSRVTSIARGLGGAGKSFTVTADEPTNTLLIVADPSTFALLAEVIGELDKIAPQISIEASVWDVETTHARDLGFNALLPLIIPSDPNDVIAFAVTGNAAPLIAQEAVQVGFLARFARKPLLIPVVGPDGTPTTIVAPEGAAQLTAAEGDVTTRILSRPHLLAASGEEQHIFAGDNVPIPVSGNQAVSTGTTTTGTTSTTTPGSVSSAFTISTDITRQDVGIDLRVKPVSLSDHLTLLDVAIELSDVAPSVRTTDPQGPTLNKIKIETTVRLQDGAVVLIGSAPHDTTSSSEARVPWLGQIPILGWLFKSTSDRIVRRRIVIAVQATQLHSPSEEQAEQMERVLAFKRHRSRMQPLRALVSEPYALLVATRDSPEAAADILPGIQDLTGRALVVEWRADPGDPPNYDVYLAGFNDIASLSVDAAKLRERGFTPRLEVSGDPIP